MGVKQETVQTILQDLSQQNEHPIDLTHANNSFAYLLLLHWIIIS